MVGTFAVGDFVSADVESGVGKIFAIDEEAATVGYFRSLNQISSRWRVPLEALELVHLKPQTRCFFQGPDEGMPRILLNS